MPPEQPALDQHAVGECVAAAVAVRVQEGAGAIEVGGDGRRVAGGTGTERALGQRGTAEAEQVAQDQGAVGRGREGAVTVRVQAGRLDSSRGAEQQRKEPVSQAGAWGCGLSHVLTVSLAVPFDALLT